MLPGRPFRRVNERWRQDAQATGCAGACREGAHAGHPRGFAPSLACRCLCVLSRLIRSCGRSGGLIFCCGGRALGVGFFLARCSFWVWLRLLGRLCFLGWHCFCARHGFFAGRLCFVRRFFCSFGLRLGAFCQAGLCRGCFGRGCFGRVGNLLLFLNGLEALFRLLPALF